MKTPLLLRIDMSDLDKSMEFIVGRTVGELEYAGVLYTHNYGAGEEVKYKAYGSSISSFHVRKTLDDKLETRRLCPEEKVRVKPGDKIGWGFKEPLMYAPINIEISRKKGFLK